MTTAGDLIQTTKRYLLSSHREQLNSLNGSHTNSTTTLNFNYDLASLAQGSVLSVDLETMYVWGVDTATKTATVQRGYQGSAAASHADDAIVTVNPRFPDFSILTELNNDINDISGDIFAVHTQTLTYVSGKMGYDLSTATGLDVIAYLNSYYDYPGIQRQWPRLGGVYIRRDANTTDFPSGYAVILTESAFPGREVRVTYSTNLSGTLSAVSDNVLTVTGLPVDSHDIPPIGAAARLQGVREGQRNFNESQPDTRRAQEVPPGAQIASIRGLMDFHQRRVQSSMKSQMQKYPYLRRLEASTSTRV